MTKSVPGTATVAVVGNPNAGKSTLFNALTGGHQRVGNYPGVTVEKKTGLVRWGGQDVSIVDVPGAYSLAPSSPDEQVVLDTLCGNVEGIPAPDLILCVVDAVNLRRNLFLTSQISDLGIPIVLALSMSDLAQKQRMRIDAVKLSRAFGVPLVPTVATTGRGLPELKVALQEALKSKPAFAAISWPPAVNEAIQTLKEKDSRPDWELRRILFDSAPAAARLHLEKAGIDPVSIEAVTRYHHIDSLLDGAITRPDPKEVERSYSIDRLLTHRLAGLVIFFALMMGVFSSIYWLAAPLMDGVDAFFGMLQGWAGSLLEGSPILQSLIVDGVLAGVGGVVIFLPQILILFFFIAVLEDSGYMARAAFLMDKVFAWTGLNGKSFVPMLSSFACAVPAIMGCRTIEDPRARLSTILVAPLMSCSARLPVYVLLIGTFIQPSFGAFWAGVALFGMHLLGLFVAIPIAFVINRFFLKLRTLPFLMELPPYRQPRAREVLYRMVRSGREFVINAGTIIFAFSIVIWALTYFPRPDSVRTELAEQAARERNISNQEAAALLETDLAPELQAAFLEQSYLGRFGKTVQPAFAPAGFDWKITVAVLASFPAREVIVSTLGIIYSLEEKDIDDAEQSGALRSRMATASWPDGRKVFSPLVAVAIMVFFALCLQCGSTVAVIGREVGWKWATFAFVYMTMLAWVGAVVTYQAGSAIF